LGATLGQADHVRCTSHAKTIANILLIHLHEVSDFVICGEGGHGQPTISANFIDTTHILECSVSCRGTCVLATPISVQLGVPTRWAVNVLGNEHFIAVSVEVGATRLLVFLTGATDPSDVAVATTGGLRSILVPGITEGSQLTVDSVTSLITVSRAIPTSQITLIDVVVFDIVVSRRGLAVIGPAGANARLVDGNSVLIAARVTCRAPGKGTLTRLVDDVVTGSLCFTHTIRAIVANWASCARESVRTVEVLTHLAHLGDGSVLVTLLV
jgi:hypothetical protein